MIECKSSVRFHMILPEIYKLFPILENVWNDYAKTHPVITSANDSIHGKDSLHKENRALDLRSQNLSEQQKEAILRELIKRLKPIGYDVLLEGRGTKNEHFHIEYDPK